MKDLLGGDESQVKLSESLFGFAPIIITLLYKGRLTSLVCAQHSLLLTEFELPMTENNNSIKKHYYAL